MSKVFGRAIVSREPMRCMLLRRGLTVLLGSLFALIGTGAQAKTRDGTDPKELATKCRCRGPMGPL